MKDPLNIVIVDDSMLCTSLTKMAIFNSIGSDTSVINYTDVDKFIANITEHKKIDLLVVDYQMPKMDGIELINMINSSHNIKKIILLTGFSSMAKLATPDDVDIYYKPIKSDDFRKILSNA